MNPSFDHQEIDIEFQEKPEIDAYEPEIHQLKPRKNTADLTWENLVIKGSVRMDFIYHFEF